MQIKPDSLPQEQQIAVPYEMITLQSLGVYMMFGGIDANTSFEVSEFIIKANMLQAGDSALTLLINSEGGITSDAFAIIDIMETSRLPIQTVGTGMLASMALLVMSAGHKGTRTITKNTSIMAHQWSGGVEGKFHELIAVTNEHLRLKKTFIEHFRRHSTMSEKQINEVLFSPSDHWLTPTECKKFGLCDRVTEFLDIPVPKTVRRSKRLAP
jgi:ATP-dependent Clp endopeptidase proteolytic subunit ClpP